MSSGGQKRRSTAAVQTLRAMVKHVNVAERLDCGGFSTAVLRPHCIVGQRQQLACVHRMKNLTSQESQSMKIRFHRLFCAAAALFMGGINSFGQEKTATNSVIPAMAKSNPAQTNRSIQQPGEQNEDRAAALLRDYRGDLVFVKGKAGIGSGFIAQYKKHKYFITNAHVLAGNAGTSLELLDRTPLQLQTNGAIAAVGHDLIAIDRKSVV